MRNITIIIGILGIIAFGILLVRGSSIDYVATVDDEVEKLELDLAELGEARLSPEEAVTAKNKIATRLNTINTSLAASQDRELSGAQQQMLVEGLRNLQKVLDDHQATLSTLEETAGQTPAEPDDSTIGALAQTITAIENYLNVPEVTASSPRNATYFIEGTPVTLVDGVSEQVVAPESAAKTITRYFGNSESVDLNDDGRVDEIFILTQTNGGSGTLFYVVAALNRVDGWQGSAGFLIGDRISPQSITENSNPRLQNVMTVNYLDRETDQIFSEQPRVSKSVWLKLDLETLTFAEVEQNFSGEADPDMMTLPMQPWTWQKTTYANSADVTPNEADAFVLTFASDGSFSVATDCNTMGGQYEVNQDQISLNIMMTTEMFCEDSQEQIFSGILDDVHTYSFTNMGELILFEKERAAFSVFQ